MLPFIDEAEVRAVLRMDELIEAIERGLIAFSAGSVEQPVRQIARAHDGFLGSMPAAGPDIGMGVKLVTFYPENAALGLHTHHAVIALFRPETGEPLAIMDGRLITEMRTAAASAVATRALARSDADVLAILGTGVQARAHVEALRLVRPFDEIRIWGRTEHNARRLADEVGASTMASAQEAVEGADVIVTATSSAEPVLRGSWLGPATHVDAVGWSGPGGRELDEEAMREAFIVADSREAVLKESGDVLLSGVEVDAELGEILAGTKSVPTGKRTVFESVGIAVEDVAAASLVYERIRAG
jgi:ornithine cyclodeaminase/alanine dehydrogenase-like protein (mu-crystallin family)